MLIVTLRHYVGNEAQALELEKLVKGVLKAKSKNRDIIFRVSLNWVSPAKALKRVKESVKQAEITLYENGITVESYEGFGIGYAFFKSVFSYLAETNLNYKDGQKVLVLVDGNQFDISDYRVLTEIRNIAAKISSEKRVLGLALRDYVKLATDKEDDELRRIEELYHLNACPAIDISNPQGLDTKDIHPLYLKYGDIVPGLICFNLNSEVFAKMLAIIHEDAKRVDLTNYQADPYVVMLAGILTKKGGFYSEVIPTIRVTRGTRFRKEALTEKSESLGRTFVGKYYKRSVTDTSFEKELLNHFSEAGIMEAKKRVLEGL